MATKKVSPPESDDRTEKAAKEYKGVRRTPAYDNVEDIPKLDLDKKVEEAAERAANEFKTFVPVTQAAPAQKAISLSDLNPINPKVFAAKDEDLQGPTMGDALFDQLDEALERTKKQTQELHESIIEEAQEEAFEMGVDPVDNVVSGIPEAPEGQTSSEFDDLFKDEEAEDEDDDDVDEDFIRAHTASKKKTPVVEEKAPVDEPAPTEEDKFEEYKNSSKNILDDLADEEDDIFKDDVDEEEYNPSSDEDEVPDAPDLEDMSEEDRQKVVDEIKTQIKNNITPIKKFDLDKFKIKKKPVSISTIMKITKAETNIADWILPVAKRPISCSAISGTEIIKLDPRNSNRNRLNTYRDIYRIIYDHIVDNNKPEFEAWLKTTAYHDLEHYYFCIYKATFGKNNFMNRECTNPKCKHNFIADIDLDDMVNYANEDAKSLVKKIFEHDTTTKDHEMENDLVQISDNYAVSLTMPTIWSVSIESASLSEQFIQKYADLINIYSFIDEIFYIDAENEELIPVDFKPVANDQTKTVANKIRVCYNIINSLSSDQYITLMGYVGKMDSDNTIITYQVPECTCPKCGSKIEATPATADELLFTRHQLGAIAAT